MKGQRMSILGPDGTPISTPKQASGRFAAGRHAKARPAATGEAFGSTWGQVDPNALVLPGGGALQFDFTKLRLSDLRNMLNNYQIQASLNALNFMLHQSQWSITCEDQKIADHCEENLRKLWTPLANSLSTAHWAGYSPNILQWENDTYTRSVQLTKIKDLLPEMAEVRWKEVEGWAPPGSEVKPKFKVYDGITERFGTHPVPAENTLWYAFQAPAGNLYGKKLLQSAFQPWFFSQLLHLYANRYFERYGEPVMMARAPQDEEVTIGGVSKDSGDYMLSVMQMLRSGAVAILPNDKEHRDADYDYQLDYLESQMRGADFERYMMRLDEEMSLALFTPLLLLRTADVGSYNLGNSHMQIFQWSLNSINGDRKRYIDKFILSRMVDYNFGKKAPRAEIEFRKLGNDNAELIRTIVSALIGKGTLGLEDLNELSAAAGLRFVEQEAPEQTQGLSGVPGLSNDPDPANNEDNADTGPGARDSSTKGRDDATA